MNSNHPTIEQLYQKFGEQCARSENHAAGMQVVIIPKSRLLDVMRFLHDDGACAYEQLTDVVGIDYLGYPQARKRFALVYPLISVIYNRRLIVKVYLAEDDLTVPSLSGIYRGAEWPEREAAEMFGFVFTEHPDLRRLLLCDLFKGKHPLRKDYPLRGQGERDNFRIVTRKTV